MPRHSAEIGQLCDAIMASIEGTDNDEGIANTDIDQVWDLIQKDFRGGWDLVTRLIERTDPADHNALAYIGAGPLQHLVANHSDKIIGMIEEYAIQEPRLTEALSNVIFDPSSTKPRVTRRLTAVAPGIRLFQRPPKG